MLDELMLFDYWCPTAAVIKSIPGDIFIEKELILYWN